jgi:hypothetical protein
MASLIPVRLKLERANEHLNALATEIEVYLKANPSHFVPDPNPTVDTSGITWVSGKFRGLPPRIPMILGDFLSNCRSSLDYLIGELVRSENCDSFASNAFPICLNSDSFNNEVGRNRLKGIPIKAHALIESLQPYRTGNDPSNTALWIMHKPNNINKHQRLSVTVQRTAKIPGSPDDFTGLFDVGTSYEDATVGPFRVVGNYMEVNSHFIQFIAFDEAPVAGREVISLLKWIIAYIRNDIFRRFDVYFE